MDTSLKSQVLVFAAVTLMAAPLCLAAFNPSLPIWLAILLGSVLGGPVLLMSTRLERRNANSDCAKKVVDPPAHFLPTKTEAWGMVGLLVFVGTIFLPIGLLALLFLLPEGDGWAIAFVRAILLSLWIAFTLWWYPFAKNRFPEFFRGKISDANLDSFKISEPVVEPTSIIAAVRQHWQLPIMAATAFCIAWGVVNLDDSILKVHDGPRRVRGLIWLFTWCRGNPNTVCSSAVLIGVGLIAAFANFIRRAHLLGKQRLSGQSIAD
jgi:hypothetical protein